MIVYTMLPLLSAKSFIRNSIIYLDSEVTSMTPDLSACLSELLESLVGVRLPLHVVMAMLTTPLCDLRPLLDRMRIGRDANQRDDESPHLQIHRTGTCFPIDQRHLLTTVQAPYSFVPIRMLHY